MLHFILSYQFWIGLGLCALGVAMIAGHVNHDRENYKKEQADAKKPLL